MRVVIALAVLLAGCDRLFGLSHLTYEETVDAAIDMPPDAPCLGTGMLTGLCLESVPSSVMLASAIDTTSDARCLTLAQGTAGPELCVIEAGAIVVTGHVQVTGDRPLVLVAANTVEIAGVLDASSRLGVRKGAGSQGRCTGAGGADGATGGGGGAGATLGYPGGGGGAGQAGTAVPAAGGAPTSVMPQLAVYGGCTGGSGGVVTGTSADGGPGGGALYVIAGTRIDVGANAVINASGAGGGGAPIRGGGGGGGSGGFIAFDAPTIAIEGMVFARGGGGGGGGNATAVGARGADPIDLARQTPGGAAAAGASPGGDGCGAPEGRQGGITSSATYGGGGGGGACGRIQFYGTRTGAGLLNPAPT